MGWMVAKSDTDLDLNEEFFAVRKRNLSNEERIRRIRDIQRGRAMKKPVQRDTIIPRMSPSEWADFAEVEQPRPAPPQEVEDEPEPEPEVDEAEVEIVDEEPEPVEEAAEDDALEEASSEPNPEMIVQPRPRRAVDYDEDGEDADDSDIDYGEAEEIVADIPEAETPPTEVKPEDFVESPVNTTEPLDTKGVLIDAYIRQEGDDFTPVTGGITLEMALEIDGKDGYLHTLGDGEKEFYFGITREEYDAFNKSNWSVVENPFANPFFDTSAFSIRKDRPRGFVNPIPSPPMEEIQKEEKPPELNGFQTKKEDDLSLLPSSVLLKDNSIGDDVSLLPTGWKHD
jgi:hypothetical protein